MAGPGNLCLTPPGDRWCTFRLENLDPEGLEGSESLLLEKRLLWGRVFTPPGSQKAMGA